MTENKKIKIDVHDTDKTGNKTTNDIPEGSTESENTENADILKDLKTQFENSEQELKDTYNRLLRVSAEFENYKKRSTREMDEFKKFANEALISDLLPVVDNLERAVNSSKEGISNNNALLEGVSLTLAEILKILERFNVTPIESLGEIFDPNFHQAMMQETSEKHPENTILQEMQKGYMMHNRLLRPAMVVVSKKE